MSFFTYLQICKLYLIFFITDDLRINNYICRYNILHSFSSSSPKLDCLDSGVRALNKTCDRAESREGVGGDNNCNSGATEASRADTRLAISLCGDFPPI